MLDLYVWATPNGLKPMLLLEELGAPYTIHPVDIGKGAQFEPAFLKISPNNRIPAIVDYEPRGGGEPVSLFESGAILLYLADKAGRFAGTTPRERASVLEWLFWQMGSVGPMFGQYNHFASYAPEKIPYAIDRYEREAMRLLAVLDRQLGVRDDTGGDGARDAVAEGGYSIADMAIYPWVKSHTAKDFDMAPFPHVARWLADVGARPATQRAYQKSKTINPNASPTPMSDEQKKILFGQDHTTVKR